MRFHVVALPHTQTSPEHCACAYTMKVYHFCRMMRSLGHEVIHYGCEGSTVDCTEHVQVISREEQALLFGQTDYKKHFYQIVWDIHQPYWALTNSRTIVELKRRQRPYDFLCIIAGTCHKPIADAVPDITPVEFGIGYRGVWAPYRVFESQAHMHGVLSTGNSDPDGRWYDVVIPNSFDPAMFPLRRKKERFLLFVGRLIQRKGISVAADISRETGIPLYVAGQGAARYEPGLIVCEDGTEMRAPGLTFLGHIDVATRADVMGRAQALLVPTIYLEPFGGVAVEAQMCGTPAITTDYGAFPETVEHGATGYRCHTLEQFAWAASHAHTLDPQYIHDRALARYSIWNVRHMYQEYFNMLRDVQLGTGWSAPRDQRAELGWLGPYPTKTESPAHDGAATHRPSPHASAR